MNWEETTKLYDGYAPHAEDNEFEILASKSCLCLRCGSVFSARDVKSWSKQDSGLAALCPICGLPHVVGDGAGLKVNNTLAKDLSAVYEHIHTPEERVGELYGFCANYQDGKIEGTLENDRLYVTYLTVLRDFYHDPYSTYFLARAYATGLNHLEPDIERAIELLRDPSLRCDSHALFRLGNLYDARDQKGDPRKAFECFSKAAALGSLQASAAIAECYLVGKYVARDPEFGFGALLSVFGEMYGKSLSEGTAVTNFGGTAYLIADCLAKGNGVKQSNIRAVRYALIAIAALDYLSTKEESEPAWREDCEKLLDELLENNPSGSTEIVYDEDTFVDSFYEQNDTYSRKTITHVEYGEGTVHVGIAGAKGQLIVDTANGLVDLVDRSEWSFVETTFELHETLREFDRIEFPEQDVATFIRVDPLYGDQVVLRLRFPASPSASEQEEK